MGRKIAVVSGKGGVGKTTIACGLGLALAKVGHSVCLVDLDVGLNNLDVLLGVENKVVYDLGDCVEGRCRIKQALIGVSSFDTLFLLPSMRFTKCDVAHSDIKSITDKLACVFDFVIIDAPAGMGENFEMAVKSANEAIVVVTPHIASLRDADKVISILKGADIENISITVNRIRGDMVARKEMLNHIQISKLLKSQILGVIPESDDINLYSSFRFDKIARSKAVVAFTLLANNIKADKKIIYDYESKYKGVLGIIRRNIKRSI